MNLGFSVPTLLNGIIKQAQDVASEARWLEHYAHCQQSKTQIEDMENCVYEMEQHLYVIKSYIENLKGEEM